jgi:hypothetical protein
MAESESFRGALKAARDAFQQGKARESATLVCMVIQPCAGDNKTALKFCKAAMQKKAEGVQPAACASESA